MTSGPLLDRSRILQAFDLLAAKMARRRLVGEIHVFGGAAMVLVFDERAATRDVDALFEPDGPMLDAAAEVAAELGLPRSWLNNQASTYVSGRAGRGTPAYDHPNLRVLTTPTEHLLAMKVRAARSLRDADDVSLLLDHLGLSTMASVTTVVEHFFPGIPLSDRSRMMLDDVLDARGPSGPI